MINYGLELDSKDYERALDRLKGELPSITRLIVSRLASEGISRIKIRATDVLNVISGNFRNSIQFRMVDNETAELWVGAIYAAIHEYGGDIYPVNARALFFQIDGRWIMSQHVYMPPRPYFHPTLQDYLDSDEAREMIVRTLQEQIDKAVA